MPLLSFSRSLAAAAVLGLALLPASHAQPAAKPSAPQITWAALAQAKGSPDGVVFPVALRPLDGKTVTVTGFMVPLEAKAEQTRFLLTENPTDCEFCLEGGPASFIEVRSAPLRFSPKPLTMVGRIKLLREDASGMYYRLTEAQLLPR